MMVNIITYVDMHVAGTGALLCFLIARNNVLMGLSNKIDTMTPITAPTNICSINY
jgi:hypothetical protein